MHPHVEDTQTVLCDLHSDPEWEHPMSGPETRADRELEMWEVMAGHEALALGIQAREISLCSGQSFRNSRNSLAFQNA